MPGVTARVRHPPDRRAGYAPGTEVLCADIHNW